jgi:carbamoyl-phosphate synthase large subunit
MSKTITIAVSALNAIDSPGPGVPVIRALKDSEHFNARIIGLSYEGLEPGLYMHDLVDVSYRVPLPGEGMNILFDRLKEIHQREHIDVIIPNFDAELFSYIKLEERLRSALGIRLFMPTIDQFESRQKAVLHEFGEKHGILVPKAKLINTVAELKEHSYDVEFPMVVKGKYYDAGIAYTLDQAIAYFHTIANKWGLPIIVQDFVSGMEVNVTALGDGKGNVIGAVPMRKLYITDKGKAWSGVTLDDDELLSITKTFMKASTWRGGLELEFIKTEDDRYYLLEINPRFPAWVYLAKGAGQNHPEALVRMAMGETVPAFNHYEVGKMFIRYSWDMIVDLSEYQKISTQGML